MSINGRSNSSQYTWDYSVTFIRRTAKFHSVACYPIPSFDQKKAQNLGLLTFWKKNQAKAFDTSAANHNQGGNFIFSPCISHLACKKASFIEGRLSSKVSDRWSHIILMTTGICKGQLNSLFVFSESSKWVVLTIQCEILVHHQGSCIIYYEKHHQTAASKRFVNKV